MRHKKLWLIVAVVCAAMGIFLIFREPIEKQFQKGMVKIVEAIFRREIKKGFSASAVNALHDTYGITVPENAEFIKGENSGFQDNCVIIYFRIPADPVVSTYNHDKLENTIFTALRLDREEYSRVSPNTVNDYSEYGGDMDYGLRCKTVMFTEIAYTARDGYIYIRFDGWRPGNDFP